MYAILFAAQSSDQIYSVSSTAGSDAFTLTVTTNFLQPTDTNGDSLTSALDALVVINQLSRESIAEDEFAASSTLLDVNRDDRVSALDALLVINELSRRQVAESESNAEAESVVPLLSSLPPNRVEESAAPEATILNESEVETLATNSWASDPVSQTRLVDNAIRDVFGDDTGNNVSDQPEGLQLLADDVLDLNWV
jgi:hypothetical protein